MIKIASILFAAAVSFAVTAHAETNTLNTLSLSPIQPLNLSQGNNGAAIKVTGNDNALQIDQDLFGSATLGNSIDVSINGNGNGGPQGASFTGQLRASGMVPGRLVQSGYGNSMQIDVRGSSNLFAVSQVGNQNQVAAFVAGNANQFAIQQTGNGNVAQLSQVGNGNMISIVQNSR